MMPPPDYRVAIRKIGAAEADHIRAEIVRSVLRRIVVGLKAELDPASWLNAGWAELESFTEALCTTGVHPALTEAALLRARSGRPGPSTGEQYVRRLVVLMCTTLERSGFNRRAARKYAARSLEHTGVFATPPSHRSIEHWQHDYAALTPADELLAATGLAAAGGEPQRIVIYFIGLCHLASNATAMVVREPPENAS
jgi:hypothetical protein